jgi:hypothetical protein
MDLPFGRSVMAPSFLTGSLFLPMSLCGTLSILHPPAAPPPPEGKCRAPWSSTPLRPIKPRAVSGINSGPYCPVRLALRDSVPARYGPFGRMVYDTLLAPLRVEWRGGELGPTVEGPRPLEPMPRFHTCLAPCDSAPKYRSMAPDRAPLTDVLFQPVEHQRALAPGPCMAVARPLGSSTLDKLLTLDQVLRW